MPINLGEFLGKEITATLRDGSSITGKVEVNPSKVYCSGYPFFLAGFGYMGDGYYEGSQESPKDIVSICEPSSCVNLRDYLGQSVVVTYRDGEQGTGVIKVTDSHNYPFRLSSGVIPEHRDELTYTECGRVLMFNESDEDIISIKSLVKSGKKMKSNLHLLTYLDRRVRVTYRNGSKTTGSIYRSDSEEDYPFVFMPDGDEEAETYTADGQVFVNVDAEKDITVIKDLNQGYSAEPGSAVEKMALALLPAVFTSLESDPNLDHAIETAIRGTFLAMFGDDITGETLNHSVSVIKARISLSVK